MRKPVRFVCIAAGAFPPIGLYPIWARLDLPVINSNRQTKPKISPKRVVLTRPAFEIERPIEVLRSKVISILQDHRSLDAPSDGLGRMIPPQQAPQNFPPAANPNSNVFLKTPGPGANPGSGYQGNSIVTLNQLNQNNDALIINSQVLYNYF